MTAIGVLHKLYRTGLRVPDDISVIGFDDIHIAEVMMPPLTTIQMSCVGNRQNRLRSASQQAESPDTVPPANANSPSPPTSSSANPPASLAAP
jgi:hypothetical protein